MDAGLYEADANPSNCDESVPLSPWQLYAVIGAHYATFLVGAGALYATYAKIEVLKQRIFSPYLLLLSLVWLQVGPAFEIAAHDYEDSWELKNATKTDLVNGSFSFFNVGAVCLVALCVRKIGVPFIRAPSFKSGCLAGLIDIVCLVADIIFAITIITMPILYANFGRKGSQKLTIPVNAIAGVFALFRLWFNLGPNKYTMFGGIGYLALSLAGVMALNIYQKECIEFIHIFIGGSFVLSLVPLSVAIWFTDPSSDEVEGTSESTPLFKV